MYSTTGLLMLASGFAALVSGAEHFIVNTKLSQSSKPLWQGCFVDGNGWWFCSNYATGVWSESRGTVTLGCGYKFQISSGNVVHVTNSNGCFESHGTLTFNDGRDDRTGYEVLLTVDSPNC